ncbi:hypothetical protein BRADI_4g25946v3 [Brachypodium distachyon]|uniref:Uncharacterized protein n=1 Tax=Brachypodium distachyon TaxID=15368 RepID=A0A0Q3ET42_BRADI|nr:hypothetical protein BRADI_4g25946v3 [Brachypodium distachyon]
MEIENINRWPKKNIDQWSRKKKKTLISGLEKKENINGIIICFLVCTRCPIYISIHILLYLSRGNSSKY